MLQLLDKINYLGLQFSPPSAHSEIDRLRRQRFTCSFRNTHKDRSCRRDVWGRRWREIHREPIARIQLYDIYMDRAKQRRRRMRRRTASQPSPASPAPSVPQGASPYHQCSTPPDWSYSVEGIILAKCEWWHQQQRHSTTACRNCQQRTVCWSCVLELIRGDPGENRCPSCLYL